MSAGDDPSPDSPTPPRRLWWMYLLVLFALAGLGAGVGQAVFGAYGLGNLASAEACLSSHGLSVASVTVEVRFAGPVPPEFFACSVDYDQQAAAGMLAGAVFLPLAAWLLMIGGGVQVRLRRKGREIASTPAARNVAERFDTWCDELGLSGRRRPRLLLTEPGLARRQAFTTGIPLARPVIVVPIGYAYGEPSDFDVVVLHELAHVQARDLTWASAVWWAGWLSVPALLVALAPVLSGTGPLHGQYAGSLWLALALSVAILVLRAGLLRRRETAADQYAVEVLGSPDALRRALGRGSEEADEWLPTDGVPPRSSRMALVRRAAAYPRRLFATHPTPAERASPDAGRPQGWDGGFAVAAATGVVAMFTGQSIFLGVSQLGGYTWSYEQLPPDIAYATTALLWAVTLLPAWIRRAESAFRAGSAASWRGPLTGSVLGLSAGYLLQVPGALPVGRTLFAGHVPLLAAGLVVVTTGTGLLAVGLAARVGGFRSRPVPFGAVVGAVIAAWVALGTALGMMVVVLSGDILAGEQAVGRLELMTMSDDPVWRFAAPALVIALVLAVRPPRTRADGADVGEVPVDEVSVDETPAAGTPAVETSAAGTPATETSADGLRARARQAAVRTLIPWRSIAVIATAIVVGAAASTLSWMQRIHPDLSSDRIGALFDDRMWICALSGWTAAGVIVLTGRRALRAGGAGGGSAYAALPAALAIGLVTAALTGIVQFATVAAYGYGRNWPAFLTELQTPPALVFATMPAVLLVAVPMIMPVIVPVPALISRLRRRQPSSKTPRLSNAILATAVSTAALAAALTGGLLAPVTGEPHDLSNLNAYVAAALAAVQSPTLTPPTTPPSPTTTAVDPGRPIDQAVADEVLAAMSERLPAASSEVANGNGDEDFSGLKPAACREAFVGGQSSDGNGPPNVETQKTYTVPALGTVSGITVTLDVSSYTGPSPSLTTFSDQVAACPTFTFPITNEGGLTYGSSSSCPPPQLAFPVYCQSFDFRTYSVSTRSVGDYLQVGHNEVSVNTAYSYVDFAPPTATVNFPTELESAALTAAIQSLQSKEPE